MPCYSIIVYYLVDFTFTLVSTKMFDHPQQNTLIRLDAI